MVARRGWKLPAQLSGNHVWFSYFAHDRKSARRKRPRRPLRACANVPRSKIAAGEKLANRRSQPVSGKIPRWPSCSPALVEPTAGHVTLDGRNVARSAAGRACAKTVRDGAARADAVSPTRWPAISHSDALDASPRRKSPMPARVCRPSNPISPCCRMALRQSSAKRGMSLSGGQKQRVTIARVLVYDPSGSGARRRALQRRHRDRTRRARTAWPRACAGRHHGRGEPSRRPPCADGRP